jgi:hypothetical protein
MESAVRTVLRAAGIRLTESQSSWREEGYFCQLEDCTSCVTGETGSRRLKLKAPGALPAQSRSLFDAQIFSLAKNRSQELLCSRWCLQHGREFACLLWTRDSRSFVKLAITPVAGPVRSTPSAPSSSPSHKERRLSSQSKISGSSQQSNHASDQERTVTIGQTIRSDGLE